MPFRRRRSRKPPRGTASDLAARIVKGSPASERSAMGEWDVWRWLGFERPVAEREVLDGVLEVLEHLEPARARYVAGFAYLLGRIAGADSHVDAGETALMKRLVMEEGGLSDGEAEAVVRLALDDHHRFGGTHNVIVTRELADVTTHEQRLGILRCLFAMSAADS